jgi:hypothetical protein
MEMLNRAGTSRLESAAILDGPALLVSLGERAVANGERVHASPTNPNFTPAQVVEVANRLEPSAMLHRL